MAKAYDTRPCTMYALLYAAPPIDSFWYVLKVDPTVPGVSVSGSGSEHTVELLHGGGVATTVRDHCEDAAKR